MHFQKILPKHTTEKYSDSFVCVKFGKGGGGRGRKKMELMSFIPKEIDAPIYSDKIDKCFCSYEIDNCWEEFTVCTGDYLFG